jgi:hypothetical protein
MNDEIKDLFNTLKNMINENPSLPNTKDRWTLIRNGNWAEAGFKTKEEAEQFLSDNPYSNIA